MKKTIVIYGIVFISFSVVFLFLFRTPLFAGQRVLFYRGIALLTVVMGFLAGAGLFFRRRLGFSTESFLAALVMSVSVHLALFVVFPVTFDRSVTMYLLNNIANNNSAKCKGSSKDSLETSFINDYVKKRDAVGRRIYEQSQINTLSAQGNCISLTKRGLNFLKFSETIKKLYNIR